MMIPIHHPARGPLKKPIGANPWNTIPTNARGTRWAPTLAGGNIDGGCKSD